MSLGLVASAASILRLIYTIKYLTLSDPLYDVILPGIWGNIEEYLGVIAACVPFLRVPFEKALSRLGLLTSQDRSHVELDVYPLSPRGNSTGWIGAGRETSKDHIAPASPLYGSVRSVDVVYSHKT
jgi:hypothetical protein